jgi:uncharacterized membrane protein YtjA (UPF0391 family)
MNTSWSGKICRHRSAVEEGLSSAIGTSSEALAFTLQWLVPRTDVMLKWALIFFIVAIVAAIFGFTGIAAAAAWIAKVLFFIFIVICVIFLVLGLMAGRAIT